MRKQLSGEAPLGGGGVGTLNLHADLRTRLDSPCENCVRILNPTGSTELLLKLSWPGKLGLLLPSWPSSFTFKGLIVDLVWRWRWRKEMRVCSEERD